MSRPTVQERNRRRAERVHAQASRTALIVEGLDQALVDFLSVRLFHSGRSRDYMATTLKESGAVLLGLSAYFRRRAFSITVTRQGGAVVWTLSR